MAKKNKSINKLGIEKGIGDLFKHIQEQNFGSEEELQAFLNQTIGKKLDEIVPKKKEHTTNIEKAQELIIEAYDSPFEKGKKLAQEAIKLDSTNADAYVYLAESEPDLKSKLYYYSKGVEAGEKAIGENEFKELKGHFWAAHETRPFMRAKGGLANCLCLTNKAEEGIKHFQEMLEWNPNDNQGIRYQLAVCLVRLNKGEEYLGLYNAFKEEGSALWQYTYALYLFKQEGSSLKTNRALHKAYSANEFVTEFLIGKRELPNTLPQYMGIGDLNEAIFCLNDSGDIWLDTKGALAWVNEFYQKQKKWE